MILCLKNTKLKTWDPHDLMHKTRIPDHPCKLDLTYKPQLPPFSFLRLRLGTFFCFCFPSPFSIWHLIFTRFQSFYSSVLDKLQLTNLWFDQTLSCLFIVWNLTLYSPKVWLKFKLRTCSLKSHYASVLLDSFWSYLILYFFFFWVFF